jgi:hypothetical protein
MNNLFKSNSRFASLMENINDEKNEKNVKKEETKNKFKNDNDNNNYNNNNSFKKTWGSQKRNQEIRENEIQKQIDEQKRIEIENADAALSINNFPDLLQTKNKENNNLKPVLNYIEKAYNNCNKGEIKRNEVNNIKNQWWNEKELPVKSEQEIAYDVLNSLCELHEKRTNEYIEKYGYDYWESTFKYNDWLENDRYWNELDDKYEKELEKEEEMEYKEYENFIKQEHLANNDRFVNYWKYY